MMIKLKVPEIWGKKTRDEYKKAILRMSLELKKSMMRDPAKYGVKD